MSLRNSMGWTNGRRRLLQSMLILAIGPACAGAGMAATSNSNNNMPEGERIAHNSDCFSCHAVGHKVVGPAYDAVAKKFSGKKDAVKTLVDAVKNGHVGTWGNIPMPAHPNLSHAQLEKIIHWILSLKAAEASSAPSSSSKNTYTYKVNGKTVKVGFQVFRPGTKKVTKEVFRGFELYNSYCFRCHGPDAIGGEYAPDLRHSLNNGMTEQQFTDTAMTGREAKGMPKWAGFFSPHEIHAIYQYVKARSVKLVSTGRPPE